MRSVHLHLVVILLGLLRSLSVAHAADVPGFDLRPAAGVLHRLSPDEAAQIQLGTLAPEDGHERFRPGRGQQHQRVAVRRPLAPQIRDACTDLAQRRPARAGAQAAAARGDDRTRDPYRYRYALNQNTDGYTMP
jgi:alpha-N-acetylglucosaminidase